MGRDAFLNAGKVWTIVFVLTFSLFMASSGFAAIVYVDGSAAPGGDGSQGSPYQTIAEGNSHPGLTAGDIISIAAGTYNITSSIVVVSGVTYQGADAATTIIEGDDTFRLFEAAGDGFLDGTGQTGWVIDNLTLTRGYAPDLDLIDDSGGALLVYLGASGTVSNCIVTDCRADDNGGFAHVNTDGDAFPSSLSVLDTVVTRCIADDDGGAFGANSSGTTLLVDRCIVSDCTAADSCAVLKASPSTGPVTILLNSVFFNNGWVREDLPANPGMFIGQECICEIRSNGTVVNCDFVGNNIVSDWILELRSPNVGAHVMVNNIFANNTQTNADPGSPETDPLIRVTNTDPPEDLSTVNNNLFSNNTMVTGAVIDPATDIIVEASAGDLFDVDIIDVLDGNISGDPLFAGPSDFHLTTGSAAFDTGFFASVYGVVVDLDGETRPQGSAYDIGAYEFLVPLNTSNVNKWHLYD